LLVLSSRPQPSSLCFCVYMRSRAEHSSSKCHYPHVSLVSATCALRHVHG
jgi:hypothetical protein